MMEEPEENRLDHSLRDKFEDFDLTPSPEVWAGIEQRIPTSPAPLLHGRRPVPLPWLFGLTALLAGLLGWLLPHGSISPNSERTGAGSVTSALTQAESRRVRIGTTTTNDHKKHTPQAERGAVPAQQAPSPAPTQQRAERIAAAKLPRTAAPSTGSYRLSQNLPRIANKASLQPAVSTSTTQSAAPSPTAAAAATSTTSVSAATPDSSDAAVTTSGSRAEPLPATLRTLVALERETLVQLPSITTLAPGPPSAEGRAALLNNLRAKRAELLRLQHRTDSTLLALGDLPNLPLRSAVPTSADTARVRPLANRWSLLLTAAPEQNALGLQGRAGDSLTALRRNHETGRAGLNAALMAEYRITPRLSVGGGVGYSTFGSNLALTTKNTALQVRYDTATTSINTSQTNTSRTYTVRLVYIRQVVPVQGPGPVRYDTIYVPRRDTSYTTVVQRTNTRFLTRTTTPLISKRETIVSQQLQSNYRFFTVPVHLRYRLTLGPGRWWTDVAAGAQLQFFLGGTQVVTEDGENFRTETIRAGNGPFRPLNLGLSGSLALNYALTNRLSVSVAPSMRWQALSVYKSETGLRQQPTATGLMFGVRFGL